MTNGGFGRRGRMPRRLFTSDNVKVMSNSQGTNWKSTSIDYIQPEDISRYDELEITASGRPGNVNVKIQLLDNKLNANNMAGTANTTLTFVRQRSKLTIPLSEFQDVDLHRIERIAIHYGQEVWGREFNTTNNERIILNIIEAVRG